MALDKRKTTIGRTSNKISNKIFCSYCGSDSYKVIISGRDACSHCGAGIDEISVEKPDSSRYERHAAGVVDTTVVLLESTKAYIKEINPVKKTTETATPSYKRKKQSGGLSVGKVFAFAFILMIMAMLVFSNNESMFARYPGDREEPSAYAAMVEVELRIDLINAETGMYNDYEAHLEILNDDDSVAYTFMFKNTALLQFVAQENIVYWVRMFPYRNSTYFAHTFKAIVDEIQLITFLIY